MGISAYKSRQRADERRFPIRLRIGDIDAPEGMRSNIHTAMRNWLDDMAGPRGWAWYPDSYPGMSASLYLLEEPALVAPFIATFDLKLAEMPEILTRY